MKRFYVIEHSTKIVNMDGVCMSLGGDDNCRGDGIKDRLSVIFYNENTGAHVIPQWFTPAENAEYTDRGELDVWNLPERFSGLLSRHLATEAR